MERRGGAPQRARREGETLRFVGSGLFGATGGNPAFDKVGWPARPAIEVDWRWQFVRQHKATNLTFGDAEPVGKFGGSQQ